LKYIPYCEIISPGYCFYLIIIVIDFFDIDVLENGIEHSTLHLFMIFKLEIKRLPRWNIWQSRMLIT